MVLARDELTRFPHVAIRDAEGVEEVYVRDSGLAIWEIAWLGRMYDGNAVEIAANHAAAAPELIEEGLRYAAEHLSEIETEIARHTERPLEELLALLPSMRIISFREDGPNDSAT
jgi:hypothetical protein